VRDVDIDFYFCDSAGECGDKSNCVSYGHRVHLEEFVFLEDVVIPIFEPEISFFLDFEMARKCAYGRREAVKFVVESVD